WAVGEKGTVLTTRDGGASWISQTSSTTEDLNGVYFVDSGTGWVVGEKGTVLTTRDGGASWISQTSSTTEDLNGVYFVNPTTGWVVGDGGTILTTRDGGASWISQTSPIKENLKGVYFVNPTTGWAVGDNAGDHGAIIKYSASYCLSGYLISVEIKPDSLAGWNKFYANTTLQLQEGTDITFSILSATNSTLISGITATQAKNGYDISSISKANASIRLYALLGTADGSNTPLLHDWNVSWSTEGVAPTISIDTPIQSSFFADENVNYTIKIKNNGTLRDSFYLTVESTADIAELTNDLIQLDAGASTDITLTVRDSNSGTYVTNVTGTSVGNTSKSSSSAVITRISTLDVYGVSISSDKSSQSVELNENALYILTIKNTGNQEDTYTLSKYTETCTNASLNISSVTITAGGSANVILNVYGSTPKKDYLTQITATSPYSGASTSGQVKTTVIKALELSADTLTRSVDTNENATYILTLKNTGNIQHKYNLSATGIGQLSATTTTLDAGKSSEIKLNVSSATTGSYVVTVAANTITVGGIEDRATITTTTTVSTAQVYGVALIVNESSKSVNQNEKASYILTIKNTGNQPDTYNLILINTRADTATLSKYSTSELSAGGSETILLDVSDSEGGEYMVKVMAESQTDPGKSAMVKTTTNVLNYGVVMTADATSKTAYAGNMLTYTITIENTGNTADTFYLTLSKQSELDFASLSTNSISLASGQTREVMLSVKGSAGTYWARVNATSQGDSNNMDSIRVTATFQEEDKYGVSMSISPAYREVEKNCEAVYTITVMNTGNKVDAYALTTTFGTFGKNSLNVPAGHTKSTTLTVSGTQIKTYTSIVTVASSHASDT
ncbi:MAG: YCF48-related protein, partial [Methanocellales archaeon]|nr:YCF48-related protein [Methanocellales archaeon]